MRIEKVPEIRLHNLSADWVGDVYPPRTFKLALFSTPYPQTRGFDISVENYLRSWLPYYLRCIISVMDRNSVIMQNVWFPRTAEGWYDERIFEIPGIYRKYGYRMIEPHVWDKKNAPPAGNHDRYARNEYEFIFTFANGRDYTYNPYREEYKVKTVRKAESGNMRQTAVNGLHANGHAELHEQGAAQGNIYRFSPTGGHEVNRPRIVDGVFPMALARRAISEYSNPADRVLDPYCGTGTTLAEAARLKRDASGFEINPDNYQTAVDWLNSIGFEHEVVGRAG